MLRGELRWKILKLRRILRRIIKPRASAGERYRVAPGNRKFWRKVDAGQWEPETFTVLARCLRADSVYVDVGGWVGPTVLFAAAQGASVYCVEPDPVAYERLLANLRINKVAGVQSFHGALHAAVTTA